MDTTYKDRHVVRSGVKYTILNRNRNRWLQWIFVSGIAVVLAYIVHSMLNNDTDIVGMLQQGKIIWSTEFIDYLFLILLAMAYTVLLTTSVILLFLPDPVNDKHFLILKTNKLVTRHKRYDSTKVFDEPRYVLVRCFYCADANKMYINSIDKRTFANLRVARLYLKLVLIWEMTHCNQDFLYNDSGLKYDTLIVDDVFVSSI